LNSYPSKLLEQAVNEFARLPGVGRKTALRLILHLLKQPAENVETLGKAIIRLRKEISYCRHCHNIADGDVCDICSRSGRDHGLVCVVEDVRDVMAIENTQQYNGIYHILGGVISPIDGIGPAELNIDSLTLRAGNGTVREVIFALPATIEGDTTAFYLYRKIAATQISISVIARGISFGDELEYADEVTLGRSILNRTPYQNTMVK
jgi:recombination protein RecR